MNKDHSLMRFFGKLFFLFGLFLILTGVFFQRKDAIISIFNTHFFYSSKTVTVEEKNEYYRNYDFLFVRNIDYLSPRSYQDLLNIYYSALNSGQTSFSFYCPSEYTNCIKDVRHIADDEDVLSTINNYVHPLNSFSYIKTQYDSLGKVVIKIKKTYSQEEIQIINKKVDELYSILISRNKTPKENIKTVHDYIINNVRYDSNRNNQKIVKYKSDTAYGPLFEGYALCGGYTDLMQLFLERMGIKNFKVSSAKHIWNAVYLNNHWYHLDLTWDDPVVSDGKDYLEHTFFLISTSEILEVGKEEHTFSLNYYPELKETTP